MLQRDFAVEAVIPLSDDRVCSKAKVRTIDLSGSLTQETARMMQSRKKRTPLGHYHAVSFPVPCRLSSRWSDHAVKKVLRFLAILPIIGCAALVATAWSRTAFPCLMALNC